MLQEMDALQKIVESVFDVELREKNRTRPFVDARKVFAYVLTRRGYTLSDIGRFLGINHATVIHYNKHYEFNLKQDSMLRTKHQAVMDRFEEKYDPMYTMNINQLREHCAKFKQQRNQLSLKVSALEKQIADYNRRQIKLKPLHDFIEQNVCPTKVNECLIQFNRVINGLRRTN